MLYAILIHGSEAAMAAADPDAEEDLLERETDLREDLQAQGRLGAVLHLMPDAAITVRHAGDLHPQVTTEPFAATREQLMGLYVVDCESAEEATHLAHRLAFDTGIFEIRPVTWYDPGVLPARVPQV
jgi:hypothetical protein